MNSMSTLNTSPDWLPANWPAPPSVQAGITLRTGGVSAAPYASWNLGDHVGDDTAAVAENRRRLAAYMPAEPSWLQQVHGCEVLNADESKPSACADSVYSQRENTVCAVMTADCLPVLFCDLQGTEIAAAHAGWRGLAAGVLGATIKHFHAAPENIIAWLGPAIGPQAFEVGPDVLDVFAQKTPDAERAFHQGQGDRLLADIYQLARLDLAKQGVVKVFGGGFCTYTDDDRFFSYRRDGVTGRMASCIWIDSDV